MKLGSYLELFAVLVDWWKWSVCFNATQASLFYVEIFKNGLLWAKITGNRARFFGVTLLIRNILCDWDFFDWFWLIQLIWIFFGCQYCLCLVIIVNTIASWHVFINFKLLLISFVIWRAFFARRATTMRERHTTTVK